MLQYVGSGYPVSRPVTDSQIMRQVLYDCRLISFITDKGKMNKILSPNFTKYKVFILFNSLVGRSTISSLERILSKDRTCGEIVGERNPT